MFCLVNVKGLMQPFADLLYILICSAGCFFFRVHVPSKQMNKFFGSFRKLFPVAVGGVAGKGLKVMVVSIKCTRIWCLL